MEFDMVVVGGGPSGLAAAIRFAQMTLESGNEFSVCLVEKGSEIGAHILSGAVVEPRALNELMPDWQEQGAPLNNPVTDDIMYYLTDDQQGMKMPSWLIPSALHNHGNYAISLGNLCRWMGEKAEELGVMLFPGFAASEVLYNEDGSIKGVATGDMGIGADGEQKNTYQPGYELHAKYTLFAEGCRGHLGKQLIDKFDLRKDADTQHYGIGFKEVWEIDPAKHELGKVVHTVGYPLGHFPGEALGGSYLYHLEDNQLALGLIVNLDYKNPHLSPFEEFQRWKHHKYISDYLEGGKRVAYGARAVIKGGHSALPKLTMPGGLLVGDDAGFLNNLKQKGTHTAMKSGMLAAETVYEAVKAGSTGGEELTGYTDRYQASWIHEELYQARNTTAWLHKFGLFIGSAIIWVEQFLSHTLKISLPFTLSDSEPDHANMKLAAKARRFDYPKPDGVISFDRLSSVFLTNTNHEEDQPCHLTLKDSSVPIAVNLPKYAEPAQRYCPAGVTRSLKIPRVHAFKSTRKTACTAKPATSKTPRRTLPG